MRRTGLLTAALGILLTSPVIPARADNVIDYRGVHMPVPAGWHVYHLDKDPARCLRFDEHAIYLGQPGQNQICPPHIIGRTEAIQIEPLSQQLDAYTTGLLDWMQDQTGGASTAPKGRLTGLALQDSTAKQIQIAAPSAGVLITASYGNSPGDVDHFLQTMTSAAGPVATPPRRTPPAKAGRVDTSRRRVWIDGRGFDTCGAPSLAAMKAWKKAFVAANIYIGGAARACPDGNLSAGWIKAVRTMGWRLIPTYVGLQAPCTGFRNKFSAKNARQQGWVSAEYAARRARQLGLGSGAPIYFDMEPYDSRNTGCRNAVLAFMDGWSRRLKTLGYTSGIYGGAASGIRDVGWARGIVKPSAVWFAHWDRQPNPDADGMLLRSWWPGHRRIKQHTGDHIEKHGGIKLDIDSDTVDGFVY